MRSKVPAQPELKGSNHWLAREYAKIPHSHRQCLTETFHEISGTQPLQGKSILFNCHMTLATLLIINGLLIAGAKVTVIATNNLVVHENIAGLLELVARDKQSNLDWIEDGVVPADKKNKFFDIYIDCGGELMAQGVVPKDRGVELTHTDPKIYEQLSYPVVSVNLSNIKAVEIRQGTGNSLIRVIKSVFPSMESVNNIYKTRQAAAVSLNAVKDVACAKLLANQAESYWFSGNKYVVFGCGSVGTAIIKALTKAGVEKENITIIDLEKNKATLMGFKFEGYIACVLEKDRGIIETALANAFCVITATGVPNCISKSFEPTNFAKNCVLINMGTPDEWGDKFLPNQILNYKKPANFLMEYPTSVTYLDPVFVALIKASYCDLPAEREQQYHHLPTTLIPLPKSVDDAICLQFQKHQSRSRSPSPESSLFFHRSKDLIETLSNAASSDSSSPRSPASVTSNSFITPSVSPSTSPPGGKSAPPSPTKNKSTPRTEVGVRRTISSPMLWQDHPAIHRQTPEPQYNQLAVKAAEMADAAQSAAATTLVVRPL